MQGYNKVVLMGNITRDLELKYTPSGTTVVNASIAINRKYKAGEEMKEDVAYVPLVIWNKQAENCAQYLRKGSSVFVEGRLQSRSWEDNEGRKRSVLEVVVEKIQFLGGKKKEEGPVDPEEGGEE